MRSGSRVDSSAGAQARGAGEPEALAGQPAGRSVRVVGFSLPAALQQRVLEMGLTAGTECTVLRYAPLGDPMQIRLRGYSLSLRRSEAHGVLVRPVT